VENGALAVYSNSAPTGLCPKAEGNLEEYVNLRVLGSV
jgi:hypothetical protein